MATEKSIKNILNSPTQEQLKIETQKDKEVRKKEYKLFFKQWFKHKKSFSAIAPISVRLANQVARAVISMQSEHKTTNKNTEQNASFCAKNLNIGTHTLQKSAACTNDDYIIEIGAGTGRLTRALLANGISPDKLAVIEEDASFFAFLKDTLKSGISGSISKNTPLIIQGDALDIKSLIPQKWIGKVSTVVSTIPLMCLSQDARLSIMNAALSILKPGGNIIHATYTPQSPIAFAKQIKQNRLFGLWVDFPPGFAWSYTHSTDWDSFIIDGIHEDAA